MTGEETDEDKGRTGKRRLANGEETVHGPEEEDAEQHTYDHVPEH